MSTITITHTHADGTLLHGSSKGDGVFEIVKLHGFAYFPSIRAIGIRQSRDQVAKRHLINRAAAALEAAGHDVTVDIDDTPRDRGTVLEDQGGRLDDRAERLTARAARHGREAEAAYARADGIAERFAGGQPIIMGHHSTRGSLRDRDKMHDAQQRGHREQDIAEAVTRQADVVGRTAVAAAKPGATQRRIATTEADLRRVRKYLDGYTTRSLDGNGDPVYVFDSKPASGERREQLLAEQALLVERLRYDREALAAAEADGFVVWGPHNVHVGDQVRYWAIGWGEVAKVNRVTVSTPSGHSWMDKVKFTDIREVRCPHADGVDAEVVKTQCSGRALPEPVEAQRPRPAAVPDRAERDAVIAAALAAPTVSAVAYFPTPLELAARIIREHTNLDTAVAPRVLEPSAGDGALVRAVLAANDKAHVTAIEPNVTLVGLISRGQSLDRLSVFCSTFEEYGTGDHPELFDLVVMNPPFSEPGRPMLWAEHVLAAFDRVAPGGRLVAIVPASIDYGQAKKAAAVRDLATENSGGWEALPDRAFAAVGTTARTYVVWMDRPAAVVAVPAPNPVGPATYAQVGLFEAEAV